MIKSKNISILGISVKSGSILVNGSAKFSGTFLFQRLHPCGQGVPAIGGSDKDPCRYLRAVRRNCQQIKEFFNRNFSGDMHHFAVTRQFPVVFPVHSIKNSCGDT